MCKLDYVDPAGTTSFPVHIDALYRIMSICTREPVAYTSKVNTDQLV